MPRPVKGEKTPGSGRKPGTPNADTRTLEAICAAHNLNVFEGMVVLAVNEKDGNRRFEKLLDLAPYLYSRKKDVMIGIDPDKATIRVIIEDYAKDKP